MKFKTYDNSNGGNVSSNGARLRINELTGLFTINKEAALMIGIGQMDRICILQNQEAPYEFYLHKNQYVDSFVLHRQASLTAWFKAPDLATILIDKGKIVNRSNRMNRKREFWIADPVKIDGLTLYQIFIGVTHPK